MDSLFDAHTGVIIPDFTTAYGLLYIKDRLGARGQTRLKHQEKRRKTPEKKVESSSPLESYPTLGELPYPWRVTIPLESAAHKYNLSSS